MADETRRSRNDGNIRHFRDYLRQRLKETGAPMRALSIAMGRDPSYVAQLLDPPSDRSRALPSPDELRLAAPLLKVPLVELLEHAYGISRAELEAELNTMAAHTGACADELSDLTTAEREEVLNFVAYVKSKREMRRRSVSGRQPAEGDEMDA
jgi:hypothetical protein